MNSIGLTLKIADRAPKSGERIDDCQDAFSVNSEAGLYAIADGVSQSFFPYLFARSLAERFTQSSANDLAQLFDRNEWREWLKPSQADWLDSVRRKGVEIPDEQKAYYSNSLKKKEPGASTFAGLHLYESGTPNALAWRAMLTGDSCLFFFNPACSSVVAHPVCKSADFTKFPVHFSSYDTAGPTEPRFVSGTLMKGEALILATDALAKWLLARFEKGGPEWDEAIDKLRNPGDFGAFVASLRAGSGIRLEEDDTTLILLTTPGNQLDAATPRVKTASGQKVRYVISSATHYLKSGRRWRRWAPILLTASAVANVLLTVALLAAFYLMPGDWKGGLSFDERTRSKSDFAAFRAGNDALKEKMYDVALQRFQKVSESSIFFLDAQHGLSTAKVALASERNAEHTRKFEAARSVADDLFSKNVWDAAVKKYNEALTLSPLDGHCRTRRDAALAQSRFIALRDDGDALSAGKKWEQAKRKYAEALALFPEDADCKVRLFEAAHELEYANYIKEGNQSLEKGELSTAHYDFSLALLCKPKDEYAMAQQRKVASKFASNDYDHYRAEAKNLIDATSPDYAGAIQLLRLARAANPEKSQEVEEQLSKAQTELNYARLMKAGGDALKNRQFLEAQRCYRSAQFEKPNDKTVQIQLDTVNDAVFRENANTIAERTFKDDKFHGAVKNFVRAVFETPEDVGGYNRLRDALYELEVDLRTRAGERAVMKPGATSEPKEPGRSGESIDLNSGAGQKDKAKNKAVIDLNAKTKELLPDFINWFGQ